MRRVIGLLALTLTFGAPLEAGVIHGRVTAPSAQKGGQTGSYSRGVFVPAPQKKDTEQKDEDPGKSRSVVVWAEPVGDTPPFVAPEKQPTVIQQNKTFVPYVLAVQKGTTVGFPNLDPLYHNVFSYSKAKRFDLGRYASGKSKEVKFDETGLVEVFCEIHETMHAYIMVVDTPYYTTLERNGEYRLEVPAGKYRVRAWIPNQQAEQQEVTVTASGQTVADFGF